MDFKTVSILGATGSIGQSAFDLLKAHKEKFKLRALTANRSADLLIQQALELKPEFVAIADKTFFSQVKSTLSQHGIRVEAGDEAVIEAAEMPVDISVAAIIGMNGLRSVMASLGSAKTLAIANKEPLVAAGAILLDIAREKNTKILPLDSEHNAIFQVFENHNRDSVDKLIITASGGPFRNWTYEQMENATPEQALKHPNWSMGSKITIDSATMMNKALEVIEASYLFEMPADKIDVVIHPQSIIHSMVAYKDGSVLAQLGAPDMRTPIAYALAYPERIETSGAKLDWYAMKSLEFYRPDTAQFPALRMAYDCLAAGAEKCIAFNAANEIAVEAFLERKIGFNDILRIVEKTIDTQNATKIISLDDVIDLDKAVRIKASEFLRVL